MPETSYFSFELELNDNSYLFLRCIVDFFHDHGDDTSDNIINGNAIQN